MIRVDNLSGKKILRPRASSLMSKHRSTPSTQSSHFLAFSLSLSPSTFHFLRIRQCNEEEDKDKKEMAPSDRARVASVRASTIEQNGNSRLLAGVWRLASSPIIVAGIPVPVVRVCRRGNHVLLHGTLARTRDVLAEGAGRRRALALLDASEIHRGLR